MCKSKQVSSVAYRVLCAILAAVFIVSCIATGTYSWSEYSQHKTNLFDTITVTSQHKAELIKRAKVQNPEDENEWLQTETPVAGAVFELYYKQPGGTAQQIGGQYTTNGDGRIIAEGLQTGEYFFKEVSAPPGYTPDKDAEGRPVTEYPFTIENMAGVVTVKAYNRALTDAFTVTKTVENQNGQPLTDEQKQQLFEFTVSFSDGGAYNCTIGEETNSVAHGGTIWLKHGETAVFDNLPIGLTYTVIETPVKGCDIQSDNHHGTITGVVSPEAVFNNTLLSTTDVPNGSLSIGKIVSGAEADEAKPFLFTVSFSDGQSYPYSVNGGEEQTHTSGEAIPLTHGQTAVFTGLPAGITYKVIEQDYTGEGYVAAVNEYTGTTINGSIHLPFHNQKSELAAPGGLSITKQVTGAQADAQKDFVFTVTFSEEGSYEYSIDDGPPQAIENGGTFALKPGQTASFQNLPAGLHYTVTEADYSADGYTATIQTANGTILEAAPADVTFVNEHKAELPAEVLLTIKKVVEGPAPESDAEKEFGFLLEYTPPEGEPRQQEIFLKPGQSQTVSVPQGSYYTITEYSYTDDGYRQLGITNGHGTARGQTIEAVQTNLFLGIATVEIGGEKTWDTTANPQAEMPQSIQVLLKNGETVVQMAEVTPNENGKWLYSFTVPRYEEDGVTEIDYTLEEVPVNGFIPSYEEYNIKNTAFVPVKYTPVAEKKLSGDTPAKASRFSFVLSSQKGAPMPAGAGSTKTVSVTGSGRVSFGEIVFSKAGVYSYSLSELTGKEHGYTYDKGVYNLQVKVAEENGALVIESAVYTRGGTSGQSAVFTNIYDKNTPPIDPKEKVTISGHKKWIHGNNNPAAYPKEIVLYIKAGDKIVVVDRITESQYWKWSYRLDKYDEYGNEIQYSIAEESIPGYITEVDGYNITNRYDPNYKGGDDGDDGDDEDGSGKNVVRIFGTKYWYHGSSPGAEHPQKIVVTVKHNGNVVASKEVTAAQEWKYSFTLPRYDSSGNEIQYSIDEEKVAGYGKYINGYNLYNSYGYADGQRPPQTGDSTALYAWLLVMILSGGSLLLLLVKRRKRKRKKVAK